MSNWPHRQKTHAGTFQNILSLMNEDSQPQHHSTNATVASVVPLNTACSRFCGSQPKHRSHSQLWHLRKLAVSPALRKVWVSPKLWKKYSKKYFHRKAMNTALKKALKKVLKLKSNKKSTQYFAQKSEFTQRRTQKRAPSKKKVKSRKCIHSKKWT